MSKHFMTLDKAREVGKRFALLMQDEEGEYDETCGLELSKADCDELSEALEMLVEYASAMKGAQ